MALRRIGMAAINQLGNHRLHFVHMAGRERLNIGRQNADLGNIFEIFCVKTLRDFGNINAFIGCFGINFIVNIGDIAGINHLRIKLPQQPHQHIKHHGRAKIADMACAINRWPTYINRHAVRVLRHKNLFLPRLTIVKNKLVFHARTIIARPTASKRFRQSDRFCWQFL